MLILSVLFASIIMLSLNRGVIVKYFDDPLCIVPYGPKTDDYTMNWYLIDTCYQSTYDPEYHASKMMTIDKTDNGTWRLNTRTWSTPNCTLEEDVDSMVEFKDFNKCEKVINNHVKVKYADHPEKQPFDVVAMHTFEAKSEHLTCEGKVVEVGYWIMGFCINNGDILHPSHTKKKCDKSKKEYVVDTWYKYFSDCLHDPDDTQTYQLGACLDGTVFDC